MFTIAKEPTFKHPVTVHVPVDGGHRDETLQATYRVLPTDEVAKFDLNTVEGSAGFLRAVIVRLDDCADEDGKPLTYCDALRDRVIVLPYCRQALASTYFVAVSGAKAGN